MTHVNPPSILPKRRQLWPNIRDLYASLDTRKGDDFASPPAHARLT